MLRAISEMAVAISVASVRENPSSAASARPSARAGTTSSSQAMAIVISPFDDMPIPHPLVEERESLLEIEGRLDWVEVELELDHRHRHVGLDADDDGVGAAELCGQRDCAQRARHK